MKIYEAISDTNIGGAGILLLTRLIYDRHYADMTTVIIPKGSMLKERLAYNNISYIEIDGNYDRSFDVRTVLPLIKILRSNRADIVNCHGCMSFRLAAWLCRVPIKIYTRHCVFPLKFWQESAVFRSICGVCQGILSDKIIAVAYAARDNLVELGVNRDKITVIINGVSPLKRISVEERLSLREKLGIPPDSIIVGIFARLEACKGHTDLIEAARILVGKSKKYRFLIVGSGSRESELKSLVQKFQLEKYFIFTGFISDVTALFNITDINVNCSCGTETSSLALSEGMSLGIPCVASEYGGNVYMIRNGYNGFTYPMGDAEALARRIVLLSISKRLYKKMSDNAQKRFKEELNAEKMSRQTYDLYEDLARRHGLL